MKRKEGRREGKANKKNKRSYRAAVSEWCCGLDRTKFRNKYLICFNLSSTTITVPCFCQFSFGYVAPFRTIQLLGKLTSTETLDAKSETIATHLYNCYRS